MVAQIGLSLGVIDARLYAVVLFMAVATTLIAPPLLIVLFKADASIAANTISVSFTQI